MRTHWLLAFFFGRFSGRFRAFYNLKPIKKLTWVQKKGEGKSTEANLMNQSLIVTEAQSNIVTNQIDGTD